MSDERKTPAIDRTRICITCGKIGGACRWVDDPTICMRKQLDLMREALEVIADGDGDADEIARQTLEAING